MGALAVGELVAGLSTHLVSPVVSVGNEFIDRVPRPVKDWAIAWFGTNDKVVLVGGIVVTALLFGCALGVAARSRTWLGIAGLGVFALVGAAAAYQEVDAAWFAGLPSLAAWAGGAAVLLWLLARAHLDVPAQHEDLAPARAPSATSRRTFVLGSIGALSAAAVIGSTGRWLQGRYSAAASRLAVMLPAASRPKLPVVDGVDLEVPGLSSWYTPNTDFYRIDTALLVPQVQAEDWSLRIHGMVDRELELSFDELVSRELFEEDITLLCVSNEVGGSLVGNARWLGVRLDELLAEAGIQPDADQIVGRSSDGFTTGFPVSTLDDGRAAMVAVAMNGEPLPLRHGFPARLVVPGLYGYLSATKWLTEIELTRFDQFDQYWVQRGWSAEGPIKVMSRIDTPKGLARIAAGTVTVAGVAWAQNVGIGRVEVRIDEGEWIEATLAAEENTMTWRQWRHEWDATPGRHLITVRATGHAGLTQTEDRALPFPDGATGWHEIVVNVEG